MAEPALRLADENRERSLPRKFRFTQKALESIQPSPDGKQRWVYDTETPGLAYLVLPSGYRGFYWYKKVNGRPQRINLGAASEITIETARTVAASHNNDKALGIDPRQAEKAGRDGLTLGAAWTHYIDYAKTHLRDWAKSETRWRLYLAKWDNRRILDITRADVAALHKRIGETTGSRIVQVDGHNYKVRQGGRGAANRTISLLSAIINVTKEDQIGFEGPNPAEGIRRYDEQERTRYLRPEELPAFDKAAAAYPDKTIGDFYRVAVLVGARRRNLQMMRWDQLSLAAGEWEIPADQFKNGQPQRVGLPAAAIKIIEARKGNGSSWVFHSPTSNSGHIESTYKAWETICKKAGLSNIRPHDLRRTCATYAIAGGASTAAVARQLGHLSMQAAAKYQKLDLAPVQAAVRAGADAMAAAQKAQAKTKKE